MGWVQEQASLIEKHSVKKYEVILGMQKISECYKILPEFLSERDENELFEWRGGRNGLYNLDFRVLEDVAVRVEKDKSRFRYFHNSEELNEVKVGGLFTYWIAKLKPIQFRYFEGFAPNEAESNLNEWLAVFAGLNRANITGKKFIVTRELLDDYVYSLRYRSLSSDGIYLLLKQVVQS